MRMIILHSKNDDSMKPNCIKIVVALYFNQFVDVNKMITPKGYK